MVATRRILRLPQHDSSRIRRHQRLTGGAGRLQLLSACSALHWPDIAACRCGHDGAVAHPLRDSHIEYKLHSMAKKRSFRSTPNLLVTGTPGTGKTTFCHMLSEATGLRQVNVGDWVKDRELHTGWDEEHQCFTLDEDKVCDALEPQMAEGGNIVDFHSCDFFPERWFDLVVVLQTDNSTLYQRLEARGYPQAKISENVQCEIMNVVVEEARASYREEVVWFLSSTSLDDMSANIDRVRKWMHDFEGQTG